MESKAKIFGHAIHPILIASPSGLLATAVIFDLITLATNNGKWSEIAFRLIAGIDDGANMNAPSSLCRSRGD